jgi:branched-chain amino acid aminotransferase
MQARMHENVADPAFRAGCAYVRGAYVPIAEATVPLTDWGFIRSDATYDVVSVHQGRFFRLDDHLDRFATSLAKLRLECPVSRDCLKSILATCVHQAGLRDAYVSFTVTRGQNTKGTRDPRDCENALYVFAVPYISIATPAQRKNGLSLHVTEVERTPASSFDPRVKNYQWGDMLLGAMEAYDQGADLPLLRSRHDDIAEGPGYNFFALIDGQWQTPDAGVLTGVTRKTALELIAAQGWRATSRKIRARDLSRAQEAFITSTAGGIMPVTRLDGRLLSAGRPGVQTSILMTTYAHAVTRPDHSTAVSDLLPQSLGRQ